MKQKRTGLYTFGRGVMAVVYALVFRARIIGRENFPTDQNFIVLSNHISNWDAVSIAYACTQWEIHFLGKESLFKAPVLGWVVRKLHGIPVSREGTNLAAMRAALAVLRDGQVLGIFPEGHRQQTGTVAPIETGVAMLALKSSVPLVPVYIEGKYSLWSGITIRIGKPMDLTDLREKGQDAQVIEEIKASIHGELVKLQKIEP